jgi:hypothetical protein
MKVKKESKNKTKDARIITLKIPAYTIRSMASIHSIAVAGPKDILHVTRWTIQRDGNTLLFTSIVPHRHVAIRYIERWFPLDLTTYPKDGFSRTTYIDPVEIDKFLKREKNWLALEIQPDVNEMNEYTINTGSYSRRLPRRTNETQQFIFERTNEEIECKRNAYISRDEIYVDLKLIERVRNSVAQVSATYESQTGYSRIETTGSALDPIKIITRWREQSRFGERRSKMKAVVMPLRMANEFNDDRFI